ncbi:MAG: hypothetical protein ACHREM_20160 [Polyangiales bacterium]
MSTYARRMMSLVVALSLSACSYTLTDNDCITYRDRLRSWATRDGKPEAKDAADHFMKECPRTTISKRAHECLDRAGDERAFFQCLE